MKRTIPTFGFAILMILVLAGCNSKTKQAAKPDEKVNPTTQQIDTLKGIDVSHFNGEVNWSDAKEAGLHFAYAKATQGLDFIDPQFKRNWENIKTNGLIRGAYHFYMATDDPEKQAKHFIAVVDSLHKGDMPIMLDLEGQNIGDLEVSVYQNNVLKWLQLTEKHFGVQPIIYTDNPFANNYLNNAEFSKYKLWIAEYSKHTPKIPDTWKNQGWHIWQHSESIEIKGLAGKFDADIMIINN